MKKMTLSIVNKLFVRQIKVAALDTNKKGNKTRRTKEFSSFFENNFELIKRMLLTAAVNWIHLFVFSNQWDLSLLRLSDKTWRIEQ